MAIILNIETSSETCSVAIGENGKVKALLSNHETKSHASQLTVLIEKLLHDNGIAVSLLHAVSVSKGPGSYTGLRIGVSVAKGLCYGAQKPLIAVNTLEGMVHGLKMELPDFETRFPDDAIFCPMLDARRQEVYLAFFSKTGAVIKETAAEIIDESSFGEILDEKTMVFFGSGAEKVKNMINHKNAVFIENFKLSAGYIVALSENNFAEDKFEDVAYFEPLYLKDFVATIPRRKVI